LKVQRGDRSEEIDKEIRLKVMQGQMLGKRGEQRKG